MGGDVVDPRGDLAWGTIPTLVADAAARGGEQVAVVAPGEGPAGGARVSFGELADQVATATRAYVASGVRPGDRVAVWAPNGLEWIVASLGALGAGAVLVPLNTRFKGAEAAGVLRTSGARFLVSVDSFLGVDYPEALADAVSAHPLPDLEAVITVPAPRAGRVTGAPRRPGASSSVPWDTFLERADSVPEEVAAGRTAAVRADDVSDLVFTSGTTGAPKGVMTTHAQTLRTFATWSAVVGLAPGDRYLIVNPFFHTFGYKAGVLACLMAGATMVPEPVFDLDRLVRTVEAERITVLPGPPTVLRSLLEHPERDRVDLSSLRLAVTGAAEVPVELVERLRDELGVATVLTAYGLTEACGTVTMCRRGDPPEVVARTSGRAIPDVEVRVVDSAGRARPAGEPGEVVVRGYNVMSGYFGDPEATASAVDEEGWLHTGDVGALDEAGNLAITDRLKDMYVSGGFNVYPAEVEAVLRTHPGIAQVAVVGVPDARLGEVGCAVVVPAQSQDGTGGPTGVARGLADDLTAWARQRLANFKVPRRVVLVDELPVNAGGKVLKRELRDRYGEPATLGDGGRAGTG